MLNIDNGADTVVLDVTLHGVTITGGDVAGEGGGIYSRETLTISLAILKLATAWWARRASEYLSDPLACAACW